MILGVGLDMVQVARIADLHEKWGQAFLDRLFTPAEQQLALSRPAQKDETLARRFAAKEACAKALGQGIGEGGAFKEIEVVPDDHGRPHLQLHGAALRHLSNIVPAAHQVRLHLSLTDDAGMAQAIVMIEALPDHTPQGKSQLTSETP